MQSNALPKLAFVEDFTSSDAVDHKTSNNRAVIEFEYPHDWLRAALDRAIEKHKQRPVDFCAGINLEADRAEQLAIVNAARLAKVAELKSAQATIKVELVRQLSTLLAEFRGNVATITNLEFPNATENLLNEYHRQRRQEQSA
jgi:hypothetical protein